VELVGPPVVVETPPVVVLGRPVVLLCIPGVDGPEVLISMGSVNLGVVLGLIDGDGVMIEVVVGGPPGVVRMLEEEPGRAVGVILVDSDETPWLIGVGFREEVGPEGEAIVGVGFLEEDLAGVGGLEVVEPPGVCPCRAGVGLFATGVGGRETVVVGDWPGVSPCRAGEITVALAGVVGRLDDVDESVVVDLPGVPPLTSLMVEVDPSWGRGLATCGVVRLSNVSADAYATNKHVAMIYP